MTKYSLGIINMDSKIRLASCFIGLFLATACAGSMAEPMEELPDNVPCPDASCQGGSFDVTEKSDRDFVNYTRVAADYKEYGERSPRDQNIVQSGAGSNMSSSIPPAIEDEVVDYEEEIKITENGGNGNSNSYSAEDPVEDWLAEEGQSLKSLLTEWSERAGWRLIWKSNRNYTLTAGAMFRGRFADVSSALIRAFARARPAPIATFYKGNRVLVVETMEDENAYE